jgi:hypothetical protein
VSSFATNTPTELQPPPFELRRGEEGKTGDEVMGGGSTWAAARAYNASRRDFTVNALLYDPFQRLIFDYVGGMSGEEQTGERGYGPKQNEKTRTNYLLPTGCCLRALLHMLLTSRLSFSHAVKWHYPSSPHCEWVWVFDSVL